MDQLAAMRAFTRIAETGSFTRASNSLGIPRATMTKLIQSLEQHLRTQLLNRSTRRVAITPDGAAYYERAARLLAELEELDSSVALAQVRPRGKLRIDVAAALARDVIIPALPGFLDRYPDIELEVGASDRPADLVAENVDCVIRGGTIHDSSLIARKIASLDMITCAAPAYLARHGTPAHPRDLETGHHLVGYFSAGSGRVFSAEFARGEERVELSGRHRVAINEISSYLAAITAGLGAGQAPIFMVRDMLASGAVVRMLADWAVPSVPLHVVYPPHRHLSNKVRVFVDWAATLFAAAKLGSEPS